jgi:hypothetical protein
MAGGPTRNPRYPIELTCAIACPGWAAGIDPALLNSRGTAVDNPRPSSP